MEPRSATRHQFTTNGNTTLSPRTRDGINVAGDFQIAPKDTGLQRSIDSVGQVCDRGNIITFRSTGGTILNEFTGSRIEFDRASWRLLAESRRLNEDENWDKWSQDIDGLRTRYVGCSRSTTCETWDLSCITDGSRSGRTRVTHPFRNWCRHCVRAKGKESPHHDASPGCVSKFATDNMFMGEDGTPITILAGYDGLTRAFFANVVPCEG